MIFSNIFLRCWPCSCVNDTSFVLLFFAVAIVRGVVDFALDSKFEKIKIKFHQKIAFIVYCGIDCTGKVIIKGKYKRMYSFYIYLFIQQQH